MKSILYKITEFSCRIIQTILPNGNAKISNHAVYKEPITSIKITKDVIAMILKDFCKSTNNSSWEARGMLLFYIMYIFELHHPMELKDFTVVSKRVIQKNDIGYFEAKNYSLIKNNYDGTRRIPFNNFKQSDLAHLYLALIKITDIPTLNGKSLDFESYIEYCNKSFMGCMKKLYGNKFKNLSLYDAMYYFRKY